MAFRTIRKTNARGKNYIAGDHVNIYWDAISKPKLGLKKLIEFASCHVQVQHFQYLPCCLLILYDNIGWKRCHSIHSKISGQ